jgi:hypothetical protein
MEKDWLLALFVYALFAFLIILPFLPPGYYLALDMQAGPNSYADARFLDFYGEAPSSYGAYFPPRMVLAAVSDAIGVEAAEKLRLFLIVFLCGACAHFSLPKEHGNARYLGGLLYMLNPFVFIRFLAGHGSLLMSYALWPLALAFFSRWLDNPGGRRNLAAVSLLVTLASASSHGVIILLICFALMLLSRLPAIRFDAAFAKNLALLAAVTLALNLYWIAPTILLFGSTHAPASPENYLEDFKPLGMGMPAALSLLTMHGFWRGGFIYTKDVLPFWQALFALMAAFSLAGLLSLLAKKQRNVPQALFLLSLLVVGLLLALGENSPLAFIFTMFGNRIPVHMIFRDSQKFVGMICLSLSMLGSYGASHIMRAYPRWRLAVLALIIMLPIAYDFGIFGFLGQIHATQYPADWVEAGKIIDADTSDTRVLVLPPFLYSTYQWSNATQKTLASPATHFFSKPVVASLSVMTAHIYSDMNDTYGAYIGRMFRERQHVNNTAELLLPLDVRYIVVLKDYMDTDSYLWLVQRKGGVPNITLVYEGKTLYLFKNELSAGPILSASGPGAAGSGSILNVSASGLSYGAEYVRLYPGRYQITSCGGPYLFAAFPPDGYSAFGPSLPSSWQGIASIYPCEAPAILGNRIFPFSLALFVMAWALAACLLTAPGMRGLAAIVASSILVYTATITGFIGPHALGLLLAVTLVPSIIVFTYDACWKQYQSFLKLK